MVEVTTVEQLVDRLKKGKYKQSTEILAESKFRPYAYHVSLLNLFSVAKAAGDDDDIVAGHQKMSLKCPVCVVVLIYFSAANG